MQSTAMDVGSGTALMGQINTDPGALNDFAFQSGTDAVGSFAATAAKGKLSNNDSNFSRENQVKAKENLAQQALSDEVGKGLGIGETLDLDKNFEKAKLDARRLGKTINDASDLMTSGKKDAKGRNIYDEDDAAHGAALKELSSLQGDAQITPIL